jgi:hypothetical protein
MVTLFIVSAFAGLILGLRFNIFALVPAILLAIVVITLSDIATHQSVATILATVFAFAVLLQIGYMVGRVLRVAVLARWPPWALIGRRRPKSGPTKSRYRTTN